MKNNHVYFIKNETFSSRIIKQRGQARTSLNAISLIVYTLGSQGSLMLVLMLFREKGVTQNPAVLMTSRNILKIFTTAHFCVISLPHDKTNISAHSVTTLHFNHKTFFCNVFI